MSDDIRDEQLSRLYRESAGAEPPPALDRAILAAARAGLAGKPERKRAWWQRWTVPVAAFATVVLTVTITLMVLQQEKEQEQFERAPMVPAQEKTASQPAAAPAPAAAPPARPAAESLQMRAPAADSAEGRAKAVPLRKQESRAPGELRSPEAWIEEIRQLKKQGREKEAQEALEAFRRAYPDYTLPEDVRR